MANVQPLQPGYRGYGEFQFLKMIVEEIEKGYTPGSTFGKKHQLYVYRKFRSMFGPIYSDRFLRSKFKLLKKRYLEFSELLNQKTILWNKKNNVVYGNKKLLREKHKSRYRNGLYYGELHFELMCQIFESGVKFE